MQVQNNELNLMAPPLSEKCKCNQLCNPIVLHDDV